MSGANVRRTRQQHAAGVRFAQVAGARHARAGGHPAVVGAGPSNVWIPACAGTTRLPPPARDFCKPRPAAATGPVRFFGERGRAHALGAVRWWAASLGSLLIAWTVLGAAAVAQAVTPAVLVDRELQAQSVRVTALTEGRISFFDAERRLQHAPVEQFVQLGAIGADAVEPVADASIPVGKGAVLVLVDGQRLAGRWGGPAREVEGVAEGEALYWEHPVVGRVTVTLDEVRGWGAAAATTAAAAEVERDGPVGQDYAVLTNGDVIRGFLAAVTETGVTIQTDEADEPLELAAGRVAKVMLANPQRPREPGEQTVVFADGSVLAATELSLGGGAVRFRPRIAGVGESERVELALDEVVRLDFTASGRRLERLIDQRWTVSGGEVFGLPMRPWVEGGEALRLHAPVTVTFELPEGARRVAAVAELAAGPDAPSELMQWADFELIVEADGEPTRHRLRGATPRVGINVPVVEGRLRLELEEGVNGPVLDRLRLRQGVVLVDSEAR